MAGHMVLIGHTRREDHVPTTVGQPFTWEDRLVEERLQETSAPPDDDGTATMKSTLAASDSLEVVEATFKLNDGSQVTAAGTVTFVGGKVGDGTLVIQGAGSGRFASSSGNIDVKRKNPKRYSIPT